MITTPQRLIKKLIEQHGTDIQTQQYNPFIDKAGRIIQDPVSVPEILMETVETVYSSHAERLMQIMEGRNRRITHQVFALFRMTYSKKQAITLFERSLEELKDTFYKEGHDLVRRTDDDG